MSEDCPACAAEDGSEPTHRIKDVTCPVCGHPFVLHSQQPNATLLIFIYPSPRAALHCPECDYEEVL